MTRTLTINLGDRAYQVHVGPGLLERLGDAVVDLRRARHAVVISDTNVAPLYAPAAQEGLRRMRLGADLIAFPAGEAHKTLATCARILDMLLALTPPPDRDTILIALGGGVCGDLAGFAAAILFRGVRFVQCPTTLLAAVDASVGGKTGVDHPAGKNLIGAFHQPSAVLIDVRTLSTLSERDLASGLAECVKHGVIRDETLLTFLETQADAIFARDEATMTDLIARNVAIKAAIVSADEREAGVRAHLNFGHTIGHAVETLAGYGTLAHGEAVAIGMMAEFRLAIARKLVPQTYADRVERLLRRLKLPTRFGECPAAVATPTNDATCAGPANVAAAEVWRLMAIDKKARMGKVRIVLPTAVATVNVFDGFSEAEIAAALRP